MDFLDNIYDDAAMARPSLPSTAYAAKGETIEAEVLTASNWSLDIKLDTETFTAHLWDGQQLGPLFAYDVETEFITESFRVPRIALAAVSDGVDHYVLLPHDLHRFWFQHRECHVVMHNARFDVHATLKLFRQGGGAQVLMDMIDQQRIHCTQTLAQLIDIAEMDFIRTDKGAYALDAVAHRYTGAKLNKDNPFRLRFGELLGHNFDDPVDIEFIRYMVPDAVHTIRTWKAQGKRCLELAERHEIPKSKILQFGYLGESLITRSNIAFEAMHIRGVDMDTDTMAAASEQLAAKAKELIAELDKTHPGIFQKKKDGTFVYPNPNAVVPSICQDAYLRPWLEELARRLGIDPPRSEKDGKITVALKTYWNQYRFEDDLLNLYSDLADTAKQLQFYAKPTKVIHPRYRDVRTGRSCTSSPNVQQLPANEQCRNTVTPGAGKYSLQADFKTIEMLTLGEEQYRMFGTSAIRDAIMADRDLHAVTGAAILGMTYDEFLRLAETDRAKYKYTRNKRGKPTNFAMGAGYGPESMALQTRVKSEGKDQMTVDEARELLDTAKNVTFPETGRYVEKPPIIETLASNLMTEVDAVREAFPDDKHIWFVRRVCNGHRESRDGVEYDEEQIEIVFENLAELNCNPDFEGVIADCNSKRLPWLFGYTRVLFTGMIRGNNLNWRSICNAAFQSRAAFGLRNAVWKLWYSGYDVYLAIHDEICIAVDVDADHTAIARDVTRIMVEEMQPFTGDMVPSVDLSLSRRWSKEAEAVCDEDGKLIPWGPAAAERLVDEA